MPPTIQGLLISSVVLAVVFRLLDLTRPPDKRLRLVRAGFWTDVGYFLFTPLITRVSTRIAVIAALIPISIFLYGRVDGAALQAGYGPVSRLSVWWQAPLMLFISDFFSYWTHRAFHGRRLWPFHAVHHSSTELDWLGSVRLHPVNDAVMRIASAVPLLLLGFSPLALAGIVPILTLLAILVHANLDWDWGPLRAVIASPRFHRWHHTDETEARDKNFAGLFPVWDILFGTYYMPKDRRPTSFGTETNVPPGLVAQLLFPFRRADRR
jgi:sterol desaturase/sphingolipid hydroxylase (fatty acid hydroxylase superfamily)